MDDEIEAPPDMLTGRTLIYDGLAQNDVDMANHRLLHLDTSNLPPFGQPPAFHPPANEWLHDFDMADPQVWHSRRPQFVDIGPDNGTLTPQQQGRIAQVGTISSGVWHGTPLDPDRVPSLEFIRHPQGDVNLNFKRLINVANPVDPGDAVNMGFMDSLLQGLVPKEAVRLATTSGDIILQGTRFIDGFETEVDDRILVKNQHSRPYENGIWVVTETGNWDRADDCDTSPEFLGAYCTVLEGTQNAGTSWVQTTPAFVNDPPGIGDNVHFVQFSSAQSIISALIAGTGLTADGTTLNVGGTAGRIAVNPDSVDIDPAYVGQDSIVTLGVVTTGTWQATLLSPLIGGTGHANAGRLMINGDLKTVDILDAVSANSLTFRLTDNTSLTLPVAGQVATTSGAETFKNKHIVKRTVKIASNPKPGINTDNMDVFHITNLTDNIVSMSDNMTGGADNGQELLIWIFNSAGALGPVGTSIAWGPKFTASTAIPLVTLMGPFTRMASRFVYNDDISKWVLFEKLENMP
jgi:hypothetical protein